VCHERLKIGFRADDRLIYLSQTVHPEATAMIRSLRVDDCLSNRYIKLSFREGSRLFSLRLLLACDIVIKSTAAHF